MLDRDRDRDGDRDRQADRQTGTVDYGDPHIKKPKRQKSIDFLIL